MTKLRWILGSAVAATVIYAAGVLTEVSRWASVPDPIVLTTPRPGSAPSTGAGVLHYTPAERDVPRRLDLRGNEIARPVARYRLDERGVLYEVHSPHTEVPRLKPPKM